MTTGQKLQKREKEALEAWNDVYKAIETLQVIKKYKLTTDIGAAITELKKDERILSKSLAVVRGEIITYQNICKHEKEDYTGHCHKWDHYKCNECGREREE